MTTRSTVNLAAINPDLHAQAWAFVLRHQPMIWRLCKRFGAAIEEAGDFYQSVIVRLVERYPHYDPDRSAPSTWITWQIRAVVTNYTRHYHKRVREGIGQDITEDGEVRVLPAPSGTYGTHEAAEQITDQGDILARLGTMYEIATPRERIAMRAYLQETPSRILRKQHSMTHAQRDQHLRELGRRYTEEAV